MPAITATAPGKIILFGEHAVVYGRPALAAPVNEVRARAVISAQPRAPSGRVIIQAADIGLEAVLDDLPDNQPLKAAIRLTLDAIGRENSPACTVRISSTIAVAGGMGSGAAVSVALIRAYSAFLGKPLADERVSELAYEIEKLHHGTPSGIDNTVITYSLPVYFVRGRQLHVLHLPQPFQLVIADTGIASPTAAVVGDVRRGWQYDPQRYEDLFDGVGRIAEQARAAIEDGHPERLGPLMDQNHALLQQMGVSCHELDALAEAARRAGAIGAKLSGGGRGGNLIALAPDDPVLIAEALKSGGAVRVITTTVRAPKGGSA